MSKIFIKEGDRYHAAFSPTRFSLSIHNNYSLATKVVFEVVSDSRVSGLERPLTKEKTAEFEISGVLQTMLDVGAQVNEQKDIFVDPRLYVKYTIRAHTDLPNYPNFDATSNETNSVEYVAVNAAAGIGETSSWSRWENKFLTQSQNIAVYDGYPVDVSYLAGDSPEITGATPNAVNRIRLNRYLVNVNALNADGGYEPVVDARGNAIYVSDDEVFPLPLVFPATPPSPFYVRWINRLGGIDYWMFSVQQKIERSVKNIESRKIYYTDPALAAASHIPYAAKSEHKITIGADNITSSEYELLSSIPFSPLVEYYDKESGIWLSMIPAKTSVEMQTGETFQSIELSFDLPEIKMQY